jgi:hypothetical protein
MPDLDKLAVQWQEAYRVYAAADTANRYAAPGDPEAAARIAPAYRQVASLWRQLAAHEQTSWWSKAAALHAAEMFDHQAEINEQTIAGGRRHDGDHAMNGDHDRTGRR